MECFKDQMVVMFTGSNLKLSKISDKLFEHDNYDEVRIFVGKELLVNADIHCPGINIVIVARALIVGHPVLLDVSGYNGTSTYWNKKAYNRVLNGDDGNDGNHGVNGESGGNVLICADEIKGSENLTIRSNGGDGSDGQDGGDGKDGADGDDGFGLTKDQFKDRFPDMSYLAGHSSGQGFEDCLNSFKQTTSHRYDDGSYFEGETNEGNEVIMSFYNTAQNFVAAVGAFFGSLVGKPVRQSYILVKGTNGAPGQKGGDAGRGGNGGIGGYAGNIEIRGIGSCKTFCVKVEITNGKSGQKGHDGKPGKGGKYGKKGADRAKIEISQTFDDRFYQGNLSLSYTRNGGSDRAWSPHHNKYAGIQKLSEPEVIFADDGKVMRDGADQHTTSDQVLRKRTIQVDGILQQYWEKKTHNIQLSTAGAKYEGMLPQIIFLTIDVNRCI